MKTTTLVLIFSCLTIGGSAWAEPTTDVFVETDPATFVLDGFSAHARLTPATLDGWTFGIGLYGMTMPSFMTELDPDNRDEDWQVHMRIGYGAFVDRQIVGGLFGGVQLAVQRLELERGESNTREEIATGLLMGRIGYQWFPTETGFYVMPWAGVGLTGKLAGDGTIDGEAYSVFPVIGFATVHTGWRF